MESLNSLTSISSRASVETYQSLKNEIANVQQSQTNLEKLVRDAETIINEKLAHANERTYTHKKDDITVSVDLDKVMLAMLEHAEECGGEDAKRYVASAIVACTRKEDVVETLAALGITWLTHFLFAFKASRSHETQPNKTPHELATPTLDTTASHVGKGVDERIRSFSANLMMRDGYKCVVTGAQHVEHPSPEPNIPRAFLQTSHILRRAIGTFDKDHKSDSFMSALTTFDILANYSRLSKETHLDDPSNGMMLQYDAHMAFDRFFWCLKSTEMDTVYTVKMFQEVEISRLSQGKRVIFTDHSNDFNPSSSSLRRKRAIPLPNPRYLAIHAAIAGILHMSAAGKFFDELLDLYKDDEGNVPPVRSWPGLEELMVEGVLRDSIQALRLVGVH